MTDLLTRIRAYVAAIPTHECMLCGRTQTPSPDDGACEHCEIGRLIQFGPSEADALLREVAALEPVKWRLRIGASDIWSTTDAEWEADFYGKQSGCPYEKNPLYTLTGATHD